MTGQILVAGIGNIFFGDDAFGSEVARQLLREKWPENVRIADFGISSIDLMYALLEGYDTVMLIDATPRGGAPGSLYVIEPEITGTEFTSLEAHAMDVTRVLAAAKSMGATWNRLLILGCEPSPGSVNPEEPGAMGMSAAVIGAMSDALEMVRRFVCKLTLEKSPK